MLDVTGFRQFSLGVFVPVANPAGTTIGIDELRWDGNWYQVLLPQLIVGINNYRFFTGQTANFIRVSWNAPAGAQFGYNLIGQS